MPITFDVSLRILDEYSSGPETARIDLDLDMARRILALADAVKSLDVSYIAEHSCVPKYGALKEGAFLSDLDEFRTECDTLEVFEDRFLWSGYLKHTNVRYETDAIRISDLAGAMPTQVRTTSHGQAPTATEHLLTEAEIQNWSLMPAGGQNKDCAEESERTCYLLSAVFDSNCGALCVTVQNKDRPDFAAEMMIEVNKGAPCIHLGNQHLGDNVVHVFVTPDGVSIIGDDDHTGFRAMESARFYPGSRIPAVHYESQVVDYVSPMTAKAQN